MIHSLHGLKKEKNWLAAKVWVFIAQLVEHCSNLVEGSGGWWLVFVECASVKCHRNISSCINTTFLDFLQPLHALIDFNLRLRILVTMFRISRLCPSVISILKVWKSLSLHLMWSPFCEKQAHNSTDRDQFLRKIPQMYSHCQPSHVCTLRWKHGYLRKTFFCFVFCVHSSEKTISSVTT